MLTPKSFLPLLLLLPIAAGCTDPVDPIETDTVAPTSGVSDPTPTATATASESPTSSVTPEATATATAAPTATATAAPTATEAETPTATEAETSTASETEAPTETEADTPTASGTEIPTDTPTGVGTDTPSATPTASPTASPTAIPTPSPTPTPTAVTDADGDGFPASDDCDDDDPLVNPDGSEVCDDAGVDEDCDGLVNDADDSVLGQVLWYTDGDEDGFGDSDAETLACAAPEGTAAVGGDCDDSNPAYNPEAPEDDCTDPEDYNCDGSVGFADDDGDGSPACEDCDDNDGSSLPGGVEVCDGADNDCDATTDEGVLSTVYRDVDGDGFGDDAITTQSCEAGDGYVDEGGDCDDRRGTTYPGADELCDARDNDCDSATDEGLSESWYLDADRDGYGAGEAIDACAQPTSVYINADGDCDDLNPSVNPGATEICNELDDDCNGVADENTEGAPIWYVDGDGDGFGDGEVTQNACAQPDGYVDIGTDCDDDADTNYPGAPELCDTIDNDCDGDGDAGALGTEPACAAASCLDVFHELDEPESGYAWVDPGMSGEPFQVFCDQETNDGGWTRIYYQSTEESTFFPEGAFELNKDNPDAILYAILEDLEYFRRDGGFEFMMDWPESGFTEFQHWSQTSNPVTDELGAIPEGYVGININYTTQGWASGLQRSARPDLSLIDGTMSPLTNWYYAVGTTYAWNPLPNAQPGPTGGVPIVELWVR